MTEQPANAQQVPEFDESPVADYAAMTRLDGKRFAVVGGGNGIGRHTAHALKSAGAELVIIDRDSARAERVATEVGGAALSGDVTSRQDVARMFAKGSPAGQDLHGIIDIVGMSRYKRLVDITDEDWAWHADILFRHAYLIAQLASPVLAASGGGSITYVSSIAGTNSSPYLAAYGAAKAALIHLVKTAAVELGPLGIRVNSIAPGNVRTPRSRANSAWTPELLEININNTPLRRLAEPEDIAAALLTMALPLMTHVTGQTLVVDGGLMTAVGVVTPVPDP